MSIYKAPNLTALCTRQGRKRGQSMMNQINYTHTQTHTHARTHIHTHTHTHTHTHQHHHHHKYARRKMSTKNLSGREGYWGGKRCVFRADLKADIDLG